MCKTCINNKNGKCEVLDKYLLIISRQLKPGNYEPIASSLVIKDIALNEFKCNFYKERKKSI